MNSGLEARAYRRNPVTDHLLTPQNAALVLIDFQPSQLRPVTSIDHDLLVDNIVSVARLAKTFGCGSSGVTSRRSRPLG